MGSITRQIHTDGKKRRSFVAMFFASGDLRRYVQRTMRSFLFILLLSSTMASAGSIYLGNDIDGLAMSPYEAVEKARPYLYESFKLRVSNAPQTEQEFWNMKHLRTYVLLDGDYYLVVRSLPKKLLIQYENHAVRIHKFTGEASLK